MVVTEQARNRVPEEVPEAPSRRARFAVEDLVCVR